MGFGIMPDLSLPARDAVEAQREMFRLAKSEHGLSIAVLAKRSPLKATTMEGWANGVQMPAWALGALGEAGMPDDLLSLVLAPFSRHVGTDETGDGDLDALGCDAAGFVSEYVNAKADRKVTHIERARLQSHARRMLPKVRRVAA